jgi:hypothetical protein
MARCSKFDGTWHAAMYQYVESGVGFSSRLLALAVHAARV